MWVLENYTFKPTDNQRPLHGDPRSEQSHGQHQDSDFIPSDGDHEYIHPAFGIGATPDLNVSDSFASDQGTLAGGGCISTGQKTERQLPRQKPLLWSYWGQYYNPPPKSVRYSYSQWIRGSGDRRGSLK